MTETDNIPLYLRLYNIFAGKSRDLRKLELINEETLNDLVGKLNTSKSTEVTALLQKIKRKIHHVITHSFTYSLTHAYLFIYLGQGRSYRCRKVGRCIIRSEIDD